MCARLRVGGGPGKDLAGLVSYEEKLWKGLLEGVGSEPARQGRPKVARVPTGPTEPAGPRSLAKPTRHQAQGLRETKLSPST